jgi:hypothetical protein
MVYMLWGKFLVVGKLKLVSLVCCAGPDHRDDQPIWELLSAADFYTFNIPFQMDGPTKVVSPVF